MGEHFTHTARTMRMMKIAGVRRTVSSSRCISMTISGRKEFANSGCSWSAVIAPAMASELKGDGDV